MDKIWQIGKESLNLPSIQAEEVFAKADIDTDCRIFYRKRLLDALSWLSETWKISRKVKDEIKGRCS